MLRCHSLNFVALAVPWQQKNSGVATGVNPVISISQVIDFSLKAHSCISLSP